MNIKHLLAVTALVALPFVAKAAETTSDWSCTVKSGSDSKYTARVCTSPAIASGTTATKGLLLKACDAAVRVYWKSSAAADSSVSIFVGPSTAVSAVAGVAGAGSAIAATAVASATLAGTGQCYVWGNKVNVLGGTETTTFYTIEQSGDFRVSKPW